MKPILTYYGGKQFVVKHILSLLPEHKTYVEPFAGGAAVFFAKPLAKVNVLNDIWGELVFFYRYVQTHKEEFIKKLEEYPYSRVVYKEFMNKRGNYDSDAERSVALFYLTQASFACKYCGGFGFSKVKNQAEIYFNKVKSLNDKIEKLQHAIIDSVDVLQCIERYDSKDTLFYLDPPYVGTEQDYVHTYDLDDFISLLYTLEDVKGKWMLSHYWNDALRNFVEKTGFKYKEFSTATHCKKGVRDARTEVIVCNFDI